jgi:hypothetical protein
MRNGSREEQVLAGMGCTRTLTSLIGYSKIFRPIFHPNEIEGNAERIMTSIFPQVITPDELNVKFYGKNNLVLS